MGAAYVLPWPDWTVPAWGVFAWSVIVCALGGLLLWGGAAVVRALYRETRDWSEHAMERAALPDLPPPGVDQGGPGTLREPDASTPVVVVPHPGDSGDSDATTALFLREGQGPGTGADDARPELDALGAVAPQYDPLEAQEWHTGELSAITADVAAPEPEPELSRTWLADQESVSSARVARFEHEQERYMAGHTADVVAIDEWIAAGFPGRYVPEPAPEWVAA